MIFPDMDMGRLWGTTATGEAAGMEHVLIGSELMGCKGILALPLPLPFPAAMGELMGIGMDIPMDIMGTALDTLFTTALGMAGRGTPGEFPLLSVFAGPALLVPPFAAVAAASCASNCWFALSSESALAAWCLAAAFAFSHAASSIRVRSTSASTSTAMSAVVRLWRSLERAALSLFLRRRLCSIKSCSSRDIFLERAAVVPVRSVNWAGLNLASSSFVRRFRLILPRIPPLVVVDTLVIMRSPIVFATPSDGPIERLPLISPGDTGEAHSGGEEGTGETDSGNDIGTGTGGMGGRVADAAAPSSCPCHTASFADSSRAWARMRAMEWSSEETERSARGRLAIWGVL